MKIIDLTPEHENLYFQCLEDWSEEISESGDHKKRWYGRMKEKGLRVKLALDDRGEVAVEEARFRNRHDVLLYYTS